METNLVNDMSHLEESDETVVKDNAAEKSSAKEDVSDKKETREAHFDFLDSDEDEREPEVVEEEDKKISADVDEDSDEGESAGDDSSVAEEKEESKKDEAIPVSLLIEAGKVGLSEEQVSAFPNAASLKAAIALVSKTPAAKSEEGKAEGEKKEEKKVEEAEIPDFDDLKFVVPDNFDDDTRKLLGGLTNEVNAKIKALHDLVKTQVSQVKAGQAENAQLKEVMQANARRDFIEWYDGQIESLGDDWKETFGKGKNGSIDEKSAEFQNRMQMVQEMDRLHAAHPEWDRKKLFDNAIKIAFNDKYEKITTAKATQKKQEFRDTRISQKPSAKNRSIGEAPSKKKAVGVAQSILKKLGF